MSHIDNRNSVLVVDDEPDLRSLLVEVLEAQNFVVYEATNGEEALGMLESHDVGVVLCDIMMPQMDGFECLARALVKGYKVPFVFLTGFGDRDRMLAAIRLGAVDFITKPFNTREVVDVIFRALEISKKQQSIRQEIQKSPAAAERISYLEKLISLMRARNNKKRTG